MMISKSKLFLAIVLPILIASTTSAAEPATFFPNLNRVHMPRGAAGLLKPYLPEPTGASDEYRLVVETPRYLEFVAVEPSFGTPPKQVRTEPGQSRDGVASTRNILEYDSYPSQGFELSVCWYDGRGTALRNYQPAILRGGTHDWLRVRETITSPPEACEARLILIKWQGRGISGTFWVDNIVLRRADRQDNLLKSGNFNAPEWKSEFLKPEGKDGSRCAKFVCPTEKVEQQQALWLEPPQKSVAVEPATSYVVELDLKLEKVQIAGAPSISSLLFRADADAPEGKGRIATYVLAHDGAPQNVRQTELVILPPLKGVRPKQARIAPCHYEKDFSEPKVAAAYVESIWQSGITWTYGSVHNNAVAVLLPKGHRVWMAKHGAPFEAYSNLARETLSQKPDLRAVGFNGKPKGNMICPAWLLSSEGAAVRRSMEDDLVDLVNRDGYAAVNWDIEQPTCLPAEGGKSIQGFCLCPRCLQAFRQQEKIPESATLDGQTVADKYKPNWAMFRCRQNAELVGHIRAALKRCNRPIEFSVYSGYQGQQTREHYGVDWALLAPHLDLAIAGYGGGRKALQGTCEALGKVPFIGGQMYYLNPTPIRATAKWMQNDLAVVPNPVLWRNRLLQQFIDGGCHGVLIWYLLTMDGGAFYYTSEAAEIIASHEELFCQGTRCDSQFRVTGAKPEHWAAFERGNERLLLVMNFAAKEATVQVEQPQLQGAWQARLHDQPQAGELNPAKITLPLEPFGARVVVFSRK